MRVTRLLLITRISSPGLTSRMERTGHHMKTTMKKKKVVPGRAAGRAGLSRVSSRRWRGFFFVAPALAFVTVFFLFPVMMTLWMSLHDWPLLGDASFVGMANYVDSFGDEGWLRSLGFTAKYALAVTPPIFLIGLGLAIAVKDARPGVGFLRVSYFLPVVVGLGASSLLWIAMLNGRVGITNRVMQDLSLIEEPLLWFNDHSQALLAVVMSITWKTVGLTMILLMAGLQAIPTELKEAGMVDGANRRQLFRRITFPLLRPTFALALLLSFIGSILAFDQFFIMTRGGPRNSTLTAVYWIYNRSFVSFDLGYGASLSVILLLILLGLTVIQLRLLRGHDDSSL